MDENKKLKIYKLSDIEHLKIHGRTTKCLSPLTLFWTGSGIELNVKGAELWIVIESDYNIFEPWISVFINGEFVSRQMLTRGRYWLCIFRGMDKKVIKNIQVLKETQPMSSDPNCYLQIHAIKSDGEFLPIEPKPYKIEFIGDSITSGEGLIGSRTEHDWIPMWFSVLNNYCALAARMLNAEYRIIAQSGWGVLSGWDNNPYSNIPDYYEKVCGVLVGEKNRALGAFEENDFDSWQPDIIVVNLGTNDEGAFYSPEFKDVKTGRTYKQRLNYDGSFNKDDLKAFEKAVENFLYKLRKYNKKAHIIWAYGMLGIRMMPAIYRAVDRYIEKTGDKKVSVFQLPVTTAETMGARRHPGALAHQKAAKELAEYIKQFLPV